jgi:hypothetical protein
VAVSLTSQLTKLHAVEKRRKWESRELRHDEAHGLYSSQKFVRVNK